MEKRELTPYMVAQIKKLFEDAESQDNKVSGAILDIMYILKIDPYEDKR